MWRGELVELKAISKENLATCTRWFQDPEVIRLLLPAVAMPVTREQEEEWYASANQPGRRYTFGIHVRADGRLIGNVTLDSLDAKNRSAVLGIVIGEKEYWGRGFGTDATRLMVQYAFAELNLHRVELHVFSFNERAIRAYVKAGFREEGRRREAIFRDGRYWDDVIMGILAPEWRQGG